MISDQELIDLSREAMADIHKFSGGKLMEWEQTAYNCLRLFIKKKELAEEDQWVEIKENEPTSWPPYKIPTLFFSEEGCYSVEIAQKSSLPGKFYCHTNDSGYATHWRHLPIKPKNKPTN